MGKALRLVLAMVLLLGPGAPGIVAQETDLEEVEEVDTLDDDDGDDYGSLGLVGLLGLAGLLGLKRRDRDVHTDVRTERPRT